MTCGTDQGVSCGNCSGTDYCDATNDCKAPTPGMVYVPAGTLPAGAVNYTVSMDAFELDITEVTVAGYQACVMAGKCTTPSRGDYDQDSDFEQHPVTGVSWDDATAYCSWVGKRLPTEWEWEYAARYDDGRVYPWGNNAPSVSNACWSGGGFGQRGKCRVGAYSPAGDSKLGLKDMSGNVWEWTAGYHCDAPPCASGPERVIRGGSWYSSDPTFLRSASRFPKDPSERFDSVGFRCAR